MMTRSILRSVDINHGANEIMPGENVVQTVCPFVGRLSQHKVSLIDARQRLLAPEILEKRAYGYVADYWLFGMFFFELVSGFSPPDT